MGKFIKAGRVVILLNGRYAGKKAVCVKTFDEGEFTLVNRFFFFVSIGLGFGLNPDGFCGYFFDEFWIWCFVFALPDGICDDWSERLWREIQF